MVPWNEPEVRPTGLTYMKTQQNGDGTSIVTWRSTQPQGTMSGRFFVRLRVQQVP